MADTGATARDAAEQLERTFALVSAHLIRFKAARARLDGDAAERVDAATIEAGASKLLDSVASGAPGAKEAYDLLKEDLLEAKAEAEAEAQKIVSASEDLHTSADELNAAADEEQASLRAKLEEVKSRYDEQVAKRAEQEKAHDEDRARADSDHTELEAQLADQAQQTSGLEQSLAAKYAAFAESVRDDHMPALRAAFEGLRLEVGDTQGGALQVAFEDADGRVRDLQQMFSGTATEASDALAEHVRAVLGSMSDEIRAAVQSELEEAFRRAATDAVAFLAEEIAAQTAAVTVGTQVTAVLAPILPQLIVARAILKVIKSLPFV